MQKHIFSCFALFILINIHIQAQQALGEVVINGGIAYSPTFNGAFEGYGSYPIETTIEESQNFHEGLTSFTCSSVTPNYGGTIDVGITKWMSIGFAASTQNEVVNWTIYNQPPGVIYNSDQLTRTNLAARLSFHFSSNSTNKNFEPYCGLRIGKSFWTDIPFNTNKNQYSGTYFITTSSTVVNSCQIFGGIRRYLNDYIGLHIEIGIGSPYLLEAGLTIRIFEKKE